MTKSKYTFNKNPTPLVISNYFVKKNILCFFCLFFVFVLIFQVLKLQALTDTYSGYTYSQEIIRPQKGQIYLNNYSLSIKKPLTFSSFSTKVIINPKNFNLLRKTKKLDVPELASVIASILNIPIQDIIERLNKQIINNNNTYLVFLNTLTSDSTVSLKNALDSINLKASDYNKYSLNTWLSYEDVELRSYPENNLAGSLVGYSSDSYWSVEDIKKENRCPDLLENNKAVQASGYKVGLTGLESKYCSQMYGKNGLRNSEEVSNGNDINLTLDYNLQKKAEEINNKIILDNTNNKGKPKNATTIIVEINNSDVTKNGRVLAMASNPTFDPNNYSKEYEKIPEAFVNYSSEVSYESGSVIKPLITSVLLNEYFKARSDNPNGNCTNDKRLCVSPDWKFDDTCGGKRYSKENILIKNYNNNCFGPNLGLKEILRDSINTGIAEMALNVKTEKLREYYSDTFNFGRVTKLQLNNEASGNTKSLQENNGYNINNGYFGFGQGFTNTPLQLAQAYVPLLSNGYNYPLKLLENDKKIDPKKVLDKQATELVRSYMVATSAEGYRGTGKKMLLNGYGNGTKTGTAEIARFDNQLDQNGKPILDKDGKEKKVWCGYDCNSQKGLYEHTLVGFAPANNPRFIVVTKVSEARPYESTLTSANQVLRDPWLEMMQYTLEYMQIPSQY